MAKADIGNFFPQIMPNSLLVPSKISIFTPDIFALYSISFIIFAIPPQMMLPQARFAALVRPRQVFLQFLGVSGSRQPGAGGDRHLRRARPLGGVPNP
jgi:hypothetical protein